MRRAFYSSVWFMLMLAKNLKDECDGSEFRAIKVLK